MDSTVLLTPEEAAKALRIGRSSLFGLLASGELASVRIGRLRRIPAGEIERFIGSLSATARVDQAG